MNWTRLLAILIISNLLSVLLLNFCGLLNLGKISEVTSTKFYAYLEFDYPEPVWVGKIPTLNLDNRLTVKSQVIDSRADPQNYSKTVEQMVTDQGYIYHEYQYTTTDGYINTLHRVVKNGTTPHKKVVFLQHGLLGSSADFLLGHQNNSLGYYLAERGYDVWLGNSRGNHYSREHEKLDPQVDQTYWDFSWDEMGKYDIPAALAKVQEVTGATQLTYIGHSMGTTMFWVALQENPELTSNIEQMIGLGPVAKVSNMISPLRHLAPWIYELQILLKLLGVHQFLPTNNILQELMQAACDETMSELEICDNLLFLITGFDNQQANLTLLPYILGHTPAGTSTQTVLHYAQMINSGSFCKYDYGRDENLKRYGHAFPPNYSLDKIQIPVTLMWGLNDWLADPKDVQYLIRNLPQLKYSYQVPFKKWNHVDYLWALEAEKYIFQPILHLLEKV